MEAFDLAGNVSAPSLTARVTTWNSTPPTAPPSVVATAVSCQQIGLTWSPSTDPIAVAYYHVCRGTSAGNLAQVRILRHAHCVHELSPDPSDEILLWGGGCGHGRKRLADVYGRVGRHAGAAIAAGWRLQYLPRNRAFQLDPACRPELLITKYPVSEVR